MGLTGDFISSSRALADHRLNVVLCYCQTGVGLPHSMTLASPGDLYRIRAVVPHCDKIIARGRCRGEPQGQYHVHAGATIDLGK